MENQEIFEKIAGIIRDVLKDESIELDQQTALAEIENWDSLSNFMVITGTEKAFGIRFSLKELTQLNTVETIVNSVAAKLA